MMMMMMMMMMSVSVCQESGGAPRQVRQMTIPVGNNNPRGSAVPAIPQGWRVASERWAQRKQSACGRPMEETSRGEGDCHCNLRHLPTYIDLSSFLHTHTGHWSPQVTRTRLLPTSKGRGPGRGQASQAGAGVGNRRLFSGPSFLEN